MKIDTNKLLEPLRADISLAQLAIEINELGKLEGDVRLAMCVRLARAEQVCAAARINIGFDRWCEINIRKADGSPYSQETIYDMLKVGRDPDPAARLERRRKACRNFYRERGVAKTTRPRIVARDAAILSHRDAHPGETVKATATAFGVTRQTVHRVIKSADSIKPTAQLVSAARLDTEELENVLRAYERLSDRLRAQFHHMIGVVPVAEAVAPGAAMRRQSMASPSA